MLGIYEHVSIHGPVGVVHVDCWALQQHCRHCVAAYILAGECCGRVCACRGEHVGVVNVGIR